MKFNLDNGLLGWLAFSATEGSGFRQMDMSVQSPALGGAVTDTYRANDTPGLTQRTVTVSDSGGQASLTLLANGAFTLQIGFTAYNLWHAGNQLALGATQSTGRAALGLGTAALAAIGASGATVPFLNGANAWSGVQTHTQVVALGTPGTNTNGRLEIQERSTGFSESILWMDADGTTVRGALFKNPADGLVLRAGDNATDDMVLAANGDVTFAGAVAASNLASGTYTPTLTGVANVDSTGSPSGFYSRVGNVVTVSVNLTVDQTAANVLTRVGISLPIASALTTAAQCLGVASAGNTLSGATGVIVGDATNDRAELNFLTAGTISRSWVCSFQYLVF